MTTEIETTIATLRNAANLLREASNAFYMEPMRDDHKEKAAADALDAIAQKATTYAAILQDREERIERQAETIRHFRADMDERELDHAYALDAADAQIATMAAELRGLRDRVLTLSQDLERQAKYSRAADEELATTREHLQAALHARDAARAARETVAAISRAGRR